MCYDENVIQLIETKVVAAQEDLRLVGVWLWLSCKATGKHHGPRLEI